MLEKIKIEVKKFILWYRENKLIIVLKQYEVFDISIMKIAIIFGY